MSIAQHADDIAALLRQLGIEQTDLFGYSMGGGVALLTAIRHPELVRKLVLASVSFNPSGSHPGMAEMMAQLMPEHLIGSPGTMNMPDWRPIPACSRPWSTKSRG